ncbi:phosphoribosylglycinamide formyltransferase [Candidatus Woesearchaeota archaeon]|nr:phosphoribosylglycinamide formyltransferase [Candidatus Woesearchaeota archaeon]
MIKLGVLASTRATDMQAIIDAIEAKRLNAAISVVISNKQDAIALERARKHNIKAVFIDPKKYEVDGEKSRENYDRQLAKVLEENKADLILLIGYMRYTSKWFVNKFRNKIMNIHPSLLPKYAGGMNKKVHEEVLKNNEEVTGATLFFVDEGADTGPIIMQKEVKVEKGDNVESLKDKVQKAEQEIIIKAISLFEKGRISVKGKKVVING